MSQKTVSKKNLTLACENIFEDREVLGFSKDQVLRQFFDQLE